MRFFFGMGFLVVLALVAVLVYRASTASTRLAPKKELARRVHKLEIELACADQLHEDLVDTTKLWAPDNPLFADEIIHKITDYKRERALRTKELSR